jgi:DNA-binding PadR family transcriptional regulator
VTSGPSPAARCTGNWPPGPRERRPFELTDAGRAAFRDWLQQPPGPETIRYPLLLTIAFGRHLSSARLAEFVAEHREIHQQRLAGYRSLRADAGDNLDASATATLDFGIRYEAAVLDWFDNLPPALAGE